MSDIPPIKSLIHYNSGEHIAQMTKEQTAMFLSVMMGDEVLQEDYAVVLERDIESSEERAVALRGLMRSFACQILIKRLESYAEFKKLPRIQVSVGLLAFVVGGLRTSSPGIAVMWAHALADISTRRGKKDTPITLGDICDYFPMGFPTEAAMKLAWDAQKGYAVGLKVTDNRIDSFHEWVF